MERLVNSHKSNRRNTSSIHYSQSCPVVLNEINNKSVRYSESCETYLASNSKLEVWSSQNVQSARKTPNHAALFMQKASSSFEYSVVKCTTNWNNSGAPSIAHQSFVGAKRNSSLGSQEHLWNNSGSKDVRMWKVTNV